MAKEKKWNKLITKTLKTDTSIMHNNIIPEENSTYMDCILTKF